MAKNFQIVNMLSDDSTEVLHPETNADNILDGSLKNIPTKVQTADWDAKSQEVIAARKGKTTLKDKVDEIDTNIVNIDSEMSQLDSRYPSKAEFDAIKDQIAQNKPVVITDDMPVGAIVFRDRISQLQDGWLKCDGSDLLVSEYQELFNVIGYTHGGSGGSFKLPDLRIQNLVVEGIDDAETTIDGKIVKNQMGIIKAKKLGEDAVTAAREWSDFKANGGEIGGRITVPSIKSARTITRQANVDNDAIESEVDVLSIGVGGVGAGNGLAISNQEKSFRSYISQKNMWTLGTTDTPFKDLYLSGISKSNNGYTKLPNGMIMQWGYTNVPVSGAGAVANYDISLPITFPIKILFASGCCATGSPDKLFGNVGNFDNSIITLRVINTITSSSVTVRWFAIGY